MDKKQAIFNENDIPYKELELIGISKNVIKTNLLTFSEHS